MPPAGVDRGCKLPPARGIALSSSQLTIGGQDAQLPLRRRPAALGRKDQRGERRLPTLIHEHANRRQYRELGRRFGSAQAGSGPDELRAMRGLIGSVRCDEKTLAKASHRFHVAVRTGLGKQAHRTRMVPAQIALSGLGHFRRLSSNHGAGSLHDTARTRTNLARNPAASQRGSTI